MICHSTIVAMKHNKKAAIYARDTQTVSSICSTYWGGPWGTKTPHVGQHWNVVFINSCCYFVLWFMVTSWLHRTWNCVHSAKLHDKFCRVAAHMIAGSLASMQTADRRHATSNELRSLKHTRSRLTHLAQPRSIQSVHQRFVSHRILC